MNSRGFTLIELLAVIVLLAIIALIATPIILGIIDNAKMEATKRSVENYIDAVELAIANKNLTSPEGFNPSTCEIDKDNNKKLSCDEIEIPIEYDGKGIDSGILIIENGKVIKMNNAMIEGLYVKITLGKVSLSNIPPTSELTTGADFNAKIKTLVNGSEKTSSSSDTKTNSIEFLSYGMLPEGYTKEELQGFDSVDVSKNEDKSILAIYDGLGKIFIYSADLIEFNTNSKYMFSYFKGIQSIIFGQVNTNKATDMQQMFLECSNLISLDLNSFDTSNVTDMSYMFYGCKKLKELNLSSFNTSNVTKMPYMFGFCSSLIELNLSNFNTSNVTDMSNIFQGCSSLTKLNVSNFNTSNVRDMYQMFYGCSSLTSLDLSNFDTLKVTDMRGMFYGCNSLIELNVSSFNTSNVVSMSGMFNGCSNLTELNLSSFNTSKVTSMNSMFYSTTKLENLNISNFTFKDNVTTTNIFTDSYSNMNIIVGTEEIKTYIINKELHTSATITVAQ